MDSHGPIAQRFPLVARFRPACLPLPERVHTLVDLADTAVEETDQGLASAVYNQAALIASDLDLPDLAREMCHQHAAAYLHACPLPGMSAIRGLEPVVNLARLQIRAGRADEGRQRLLNLYKAVEKDPLLTRADRIVVNSRLSERTYRGAGVPAERLMLVPNFVDAPQGDEAPQGDTGRWLVAGRLSAEKGVLELLRQWPAQEPLDVVGGGELLADCKAAAPPSVRFLGQLDRAELCRRMGSWRGLVFPSRWYEVQPCVQIEALAAGLPTLAFEGSSVADSVREHGTGLVTRWNKPLVPVLAEAGARFPSLRDHCRQVYADHFTERSWITRIATAYEEATRVAGSRIGVPT